MKRLIHTLVTPALALAAIVIATPVFAGPPLLCHPFEIGQARSLPWDGAGGWSHGQSGYKVDRVVADTEALLISSTPVLVRMETLRRASLYASTNPQVARQLLSRLVARAEASEAAGRPDALALLDAAYVTEAYREIAMIPEFSERAEGVRAAIGNADGYALISRSIAARPDDPAIHFAAALIAADKNRARYADHATKARAGAAADQLLARNLKLVQ